jgi:hypothetical protein
VSDSYSPTERMCKFFEILLKVDRRLGIVTSGKEFIKHKESTKKSKEKNDHLS